MRKEHEEKIKNLKEGEVYIHAEKEDGHNLMVAVGGNGIQILSVVNMILLSMAQENDFSYEDMLGVLQDVFENEHKCGVMM